ncbi:MAG: glycosyltransferase family 2 protein [bacterium]
MAYPFVTILMPMRNEAGFIRESLLSLLAQNYPADCMEIIVLDGESDDESPQIVREIAAGDSRVKLLSNPKRHQGAGLNIGIAAANGEIVVRADAHAWYDAEYVAIIVKHLQDGDADNVGGAQNLQGKNIFSKAVAVALTSALGSGNAAYRSAKEAKIVDTVWLGAWKKETLLKIGGYDEDMIRNQDYEMNIRLRQSGGKILFDPALKSICYTRSCPGKLFRQYFDYGLYRSLTAKKHPGTLMLRQLLPPIIMLSMLFCLLLSLVSCWFVLPLLFYIVIICCYSLFSAFKNGIKFLPFLLIIHPIIHFSWAFGFCFGMIKWRKKINKKS